MPTDKHSTDIAACKGWDENLPVTLHHAIHPGIAPEPHWNNQTYRGKTVFVTGASRGIGRAIAVFYAKAGAAVTISGRSRETLERTKAVILAEAPDAQVEMCAVDVKDSRGVHDAVRATVQRFGKLDIVVANAGAANPYDLPMTEREPDEWWDVFEVNIFGVYNYVRAAMTYLKQTNGYFVAVGSIGAQLLSPFGSAYNTSKHAVNRLVEFIAQENPEVTVFSLHPGSVDTQLFKDSKLGELGITTPEPTEFTAAFMLHLTSGRFDWLNGRYVDARWDMEEVERDWKARILEDDLLVNKLAV